MDKFCLNAKKLKATLVAALALVASFAVINCNGTRYRTAELDLSRGEVFNQLDALGAMTTNSAMNGQSSAQPLQSVRAMAGEEAATLYYGEGPGSMGSVEQVAPMDKGFLADLLGANVAGSIKNIYLYFVLTEHPDGYRGGLVISGFTGLGPAPAVANPSPVVNPNPSASPEPAASAAPQNVHPNADFYAVAINDGNQGLPPGDFEDDQTWSMDVMVNGMQLRLVTYDVTDGDLSDTIQFDIYQVINGEESFVGKVNLTQPEE